MGKARKSDEIAINIRIFEMIKICMMHNLRVKLGAYIWCGGAEGRDMLVTQYKSHAVQFL